MLVVTEAVSIDSEKVTEMFSLIETPVWLSVGDMEETVGAVVSVVVVVVLLSSLLFLAHEKMVRLKRDMRIMYNIFLICYLDKKSKNTTNNEDTQFNVNWFVLQE